LPRTRDGILDRNELESIYGVHHEKAKKATGGSVEVHTQKAREIVQVVLDKLDSNGDGVLTMREFVAGGVGGLPNFAGVEHLGHHYGEAQPE
jgi:Ca2+-binding EF-hand superfamily protein